MQDPQILVDANLFADRLKRTSEEVQIVQAQVQRVI